MAEGLEGYVDYLFLSSVSLISKISQFFEFSLFFIVYTKYEDCAREIHVTRKWLIVRLLHPYVKIDLLRFL